MLNNAQQRSTTLNNVRQRSTTFDNDQSRVAAFVSVRVASLESGESLGRVDGRGQAVHVGTLALRHPALPAAALASDGSAARSQPALHVEAHTLGHGHVAHSLALDRVLREELSENTLLAVTSN